MLAGKVFIEVRAHEGGLIAIDPRSITAVCVNHLGKAAIFTVSNAYATIHEYAEVIAALQEPTDGE